MSHHWISKKSITAFSTVSSRILRITLITCYQIITINKTGWTVTVICKWTWALKTDFANRWVTIVTFCTLATVWFSNIFFTKTDATCPFANFRLCAIYIALTGCRK